MRKRTKKSCFIIFLKKQTEFVCDALSPTRFAGAPSRRGPRIGSNRFLACSTNPNLNPHLYLLFLIPNTLTTEETWVFHAAGSRRSLTLAEFARSSHLRSASVNREMTAPFA